MVEDVLGEDEHTPGRAADCLMFIGANLLTKLEGWNDTVSQCEQLVRQKVAEERFQEHVTKCVAEVRAWDGPD